MEDRGVGLRKTSKKSKIEEYTKYMVFHDSVLGEPVNVEVTANMVEDYIFYKK